MTNVDLCLWWIIMQWIMFVLCSRWRTCTLWRARETGEHSGATCRTWVGNQVAPLAHTPVFVVLFQSLRAAICDTAALPVPPSLMLYVHVVCKHIKYYFYILCNMIFSCVCILFVIRYTDFLQGKSNSCQNSWSQKSKETTHSVKNDKLFSPK